MKIVSYNIQYGKGADGIYDLERIANEIRDADIIGLQEVERFWKRSGNIDEPAELAQLLPEHHWVYGANLDMDASFKDGEGRIISRRCQFGTMVLSRWPIISSRNFPLPKFGTLTQHSIQQGLLETVIDPGTGPVRVYSVHLSHLCSETRLPQVEEIKAIVERAPSEGGAWCGGHPDPSAGWTEGDMPPMPRDVILLGDMNFTHESPEYTAITGPMTPGHGRLYNTDGLVDAWVLGGNREEDGVSLAEGNARIDHCFVSASLADKVVSARIDGNAKGSDHLPLWVTMDMNRKA